MAAGGGRALRSIGAPVYERGSTRPGGISVTFMTKSILYVTDRYLYKFRSQEFYDALRKANEKAALAVQRGMADSLNAQIGPRPQREGQRLETSIMDPQNAIAHPNNFQVGVEAWLNKSPAALYWRSVESGRKAYSTRALFFTPGGPFVAPMTGSFEHMRMIQFNTAGQRKRAGKTTNGGRVPGVAIRVRAFKGYHYFKGGRKAFDNFNMADEYTRVLRNAGFPINKGTRGDYFKGSK